MRHEFLFKIKMNAQLKFDENCYCSDRSDSLYDFQDKGHQRSAEILHRSRESSNLRTQRVRSDETMISVFSVKVVYD